MGAKMINLRRGWKLGVGFSVALMIILGLIWLSRPVVPSFIGRQASFIIAYPGEKNSAKIDRSSFKYDTNNKILTYTSSIDSTHLVVTNQAAPDTFTDVPQTYDKLLTSMHAYSNFDSAAGKVSLTHPPNVNNQQVAVVIIQGTLMFVRADHDLDQDQWRRFFNNLLISK